MHVDGTYIRRHLKETVPWGTITCSGMGKQNLRAKKVYWFGIGIFRLSTVLLMTENSNERKDIVQQL